MFYYVANPKDNMNDDAPIVFPQPYNMTDRTFYNTQTSYVRRFRRIVLPDLKVTLEEPGMGHKPDTIRFGGGENTHLLLTFCKELAILLNIASISSVQRV